MSEERVSGCLAGKTLEDLAKIVDTHSDPHLMGCLPCRLALALKRLPKASADVPSTSPQPPLRE